MNHGDISTIIPSMPMDIMLGHHQLHPVHCSAPFLVLTTCRRLGQAALKPSAIWKCEQLYRGKKGWLCSTYFNYSGRCRWFLFKSLWKCGENLALSLLILIAVTSPEDNILLDKAVVFFFNCFSIQEDRWTWSCKFNKNLFLRCLFLLSVCQLFAHFSEVILFICT